ncbi:hypothetical protein [Thiolapillus brandeum]|uniref:Uncharacterized protein n=1 Tax=Thiolapillus brandeum TaxID=1076588 RepID=A0A7U6JH14_9GAMM|nr:hypothetical protein [Thiolapillus brandeum]BAO43911.1 hypothetical protein TBH_C0981 [Thiolapillus brandeum]
MKQIISAIFLFLSISPASAGNHLNSNPFVDMMRAMLNMFDAMQAMQNFSGHSGYSSYPPMRAPVPDPATGDTPAMADLEGSWASPKRLLLIIKKNYARMYWSKDQYRDFYVEVFPGHLKLTDADTGRSQEFELRLKDRQLALRDPKGRILQFIRMNDHVQSRPTPEPDAEEGPNFWDPNTP